MRTNLSDMFGDFGGIGLVFIVAVIWFRHHRYRSAAINAGTSDAVDLVSKCHRALARFDNLDYIIIGIYLLIGTKFALAFLSKYWLKCTIVDCGFSLQRDLERLLIWPYYIWINAV